MSNRQDSVQWSGHQRHDRAAAHRKGPANPFVAAWLPPGMSEIIGLFAFMGVWLALQTWVLPRLGIPT